MHCHGNGRAKNLKIRCHKVSSGCATGAAIATRDALSFLGNVNPETGEVVDPAHELYGKCIAGKILIFPRGKGSTVGSYIIYQLKKRGKAPLAMINLKSEPIVAIGAVISGIPLVDGVTEDLLRLKEGTYVAVNADKGFIEI
jgi:predicted aconitase with swiveling domain